MVFSAYASLKKPLVKADSQFIGVIIYTVMIFLVMLHFEWGLVYGVGGIMASVDFMGFKYVKIKENKVNNVKEREL